MSRSFLLFCLFSVSFYLIGPKLWKHATNRSNAFSAPTHHIPSHIAKLLGPYSPCYPVETFSSALEVDQVHVLQRHGARYPTSQALRGLGTAVDKLKRATSYHDSRLSFLKDYQLKLKSDALIPFGRQESYFSGSQTYQRYKHLDDYCHRRPFIRASSSPRVVESAYAFARGFADSSKSFAPVDNVLVIADGPESNDTLANHRCPNLDTSLASKAISEWATHFSATTAKLNTAAPGANLENRDIPGLMSLCSFDTLAHNRKSPWCDLFEVQDWEKLSYLFDLQKYYFTGPGNPLGKVQGIGYVTELLTRLTGERYIDADQTQTNHTLNDSEETFPLDACIYSDFTHDNQMIPIFAALGLLDTMSKLDPLVNDPHHAFRTASLVPFASRFMLERVKLHGKHYIRILINDKLISLKHLCPTIKGDLCPLSEFVNSVSAYNMGAGQKDWLGCFD